MATAWQSGVRQNDIHTAISLVAAPATEPVTVSEFKAWQRVILTDEDSSVIEELLAAAREKCEVFTRRQFITATRRFSLDRFPCDWIELPLPPTIAVSSLTYVDTDGTTQTWASSNYTVDAYSEPGRLQPAYNVTWPTHRCQVNAINVTYTCGYGSAASSVPAAIKTAIKQWAGCMFENRDVDVEMPRSVKALLTTVRWGSYP